MLTWFVVNDTELKITESAVVCFKYSSSLNKAVSH